MTDIALTRDEKFYGQQNVSGVHERVGLQSRDGLNFLMTFRMIFRVEFGLSHHFCKSLWAS